MRAKPYFKTLFRVKTSEPTASDHWQGGPTTHKGANCPACSKRLLLLWDINATDPILLRWNKNRFGGLKRLPLFYCWGCCGDISYSIKTEKEVRVIGTTGRAGQAVRAPA